MDEACSTNGDKRCIENLGINPREENTSGPRCGWEDDIKWIFHK
jgi:hypothetical protein